MKRCKVTLDSPCWSATLGRRVEPGEVIEVEDDLANEIEWLRPVTAKKKATKSDDEAGASKAKES